MSCSRCSDELPETTELCVDCVANGWSYDQGRFVHDGKTCLLALQRIREKEAYPILLKIIDALKPLERNDVTGEWLRKELSDLIVVAANEVIPFAYKNGLSYGSDFGDIKAEGQSETEAVKKLKTK